MSSPPWSPGPAVAELPPWKRALLERKRAKLVAGAELEVERGPWRQQQVLKQPAGAGAEGATATAKQPEPEPSWAAGERLVVAESLGPLRENPFMRLESERRRGRRRRGVPPVQPPPQPGPPAAASPASPPRAAPSLEPPALARLLELYASMPGIRTIRADNILIIESRDEGEAAPKDLGPPRKRGGHSPRPHRQPASSPGSGSSIRQDPFRDLLSRGGSAVTEIRAAEVVIYEPQPMSPSPPAAPGEDPESEQGRVSRLLQKFDRRPRSAMTRGRWWGGDAPCPEPVVPNTYPGEAPAPASPTPGARPGSPRSLQPGSFVQKTGSNSFTVNPRGCRPGPVAPGHTAAAPALSNGPMEPEEAALPAPPRGPGRRVALATPKPVPSPNTTAAVSPVQANSWKPKLPGAVENPPLLSPRSSASLDSNATASSPQPTLLLSSSCSFEIRPAPKPDLDVIPAHDLQAQALASLRLNSRNSFLFVPLRKREAAAAPDATDTHPSLSGGPHSASLEKPVEALVPVTYIDEDLVELEAGHLPPLKALSPRLEGFDVPTEGNLALDVEDSAVLSYRPHPAGFATLSPKGSNTFTIVPKRKPPSAGLETFSRVRLQEEEEEEEEEESQAKARTDVSHQDLGRLLKKCYPTVNEIEVIGGYLSLDRSCMSKSGSRRKKMKISFSETSLQTMYEYPPESSLVEEEEEEEDEYATEVDETPALFIPRPSSTLHPSTTNSGLSSYTPKHSMEFSKWQEQQYEEIPPSTGAFPHDADLPGNQVMLTPADKSSLSDFSSEPALYF
ncbi:taperin [Rhineura floridana]|uniref:taperin n=1 Tax=Rhineura floridana TaxID=261503 RepID=UPI002AC88636|nr:taperin [Rhineura floridana]